MKSKTPEYRVWSDMKQRCLNPRHKSYGNYGGRGIEVCEEWVCFDNFLRDMGKRPNGTSIDRIDVNEGYCKDNCRWATVEQQSRNKRVHLKHDVGVSFDKKYSVWRPYISVAGVSYALGSFKDKNEAVAARVNALRRYEVSGELPREKGGVPLNNTSGVRGVSFNAGKNCWEAYAYVEKRKISLGCFGSKEEAVFARSEYDTKRHNITNTTKE